MLLSCFELRCWCCLWLCIGLSNSGFGQTFVAEPWHQSLSPIQTFELNNALLEPVLSQTLSRWDNDSPDQGAYLALPLPDFSQRTYQIWRSPQMDPKLAAKYPDIQTYFGQAIQDPRQTVYLLQIAQLIKVFYFDHRGMLYRLESIPQTGHHYQFVFPADEGSAGALRNACQVDSGSSDDYFREDTSGKERRGETRLFRYRLALACTGEYGSYHGGTKAGVMAAMNELLLQTNAIYERELSIHFDLVANNDQLIFLDSLTDPYDNDDVVNLLESNKTVCNYAIGYPNYDLGHVLATKFGGQAQIGSVCNFSRKAQAFSGLPKPEGYYLTAIFAHEIGHQLGAQHTQSGDCNRNLATALEPGSGSTLMAYAGICAPNVADLPDSYFHGTSLDLIHRKAEQGVIFGCSAGIRTENLPPAAEAGPDLYVPLGMSFLLKGSGSDPNGDSLSFLWEQVDTFEPADSSGTSGPIFRSRPPAVAPVRRIGHRNDPWESLPTNARRATFRLTVKDHHMGLGSNDYDEVSVHFIDSVAPLSVLYPNLPKQQLLADTTYTLRWSVGDTDQSPVNCQTVDILLSTDGGEQYDQLLAADVPNSGTMAVQMPSIAAADCKIRISCSNGYLFDDSDHTFALIFQTAGDTATIDTLSQVPVDTLEQPEPDTTQLPVTDSLDSTADTLSQSPTDTIPDAPADTTQLPTTDTLDSTVDTLAQSPADTVPDMPADTTQLPTADTLDSPVDTLAQSPADTIPDMPADTTSTLPQDTLEQAPIDTISIPVDTLPDMPPDTIALSQENTVPKVPPGDTTASYPPAETPSPSNGQSNCRLCQATLTLWPNPTQGLAYLRIKLEKPEMTTIQLMAPSGQILSTHSLSLEAGIHTLDWSLSELPAGVYRFRIVAGQQSWTKALILHR